MTGAAAAVLTGAGVSILVFGTIAALVVADVPAAVLLALGLGPLGLLGAWALASLRGLRRRGRFRSRPLTGWRLTATAFASGALAFGSALAGLRGSATGAAVLAVLAAATAMRCAVAARMERAPRHCPRHARWTEADREWLRETGAALTWPQEKAGPG